MLYDRPVSELMATAAESLPAPFQPSDVVAWFAEHYPLVKATTVRAHVTGLTANNANRRHYAWLARRPPLFIKRPDNRLEVFDPDVHLVDQPNVHDLTPADMADGETPADIEPQEFYLEAYLEEFLITNWDRIDWGRRLRLWRGPDGEDGHQLSTPVGRLDLLCQDSDTGALVVIELKRGLPSDRVVGQTARYMGWVTDHLAHGSPVHGIIICHDVDDRLRYAVRPIPQLSLLAYEINFSLRPC